MSCIGAGVNYLHWREQKQECHICIKIVLNKPLKILHNSILIVNKVPLFKKKRYIIKFRIEAIPNSHYR